MNDDLEMPDDPFQPGELDDVLPPTEGEWATASADEMFGSRVEPVLFLAAHAILKAGGALVLTPEDMTKRLRLAFDLHYFRETGNIRVYALEGEG